MASSDFVLTCILNEAKQGEPKRARYLLKKARDYLARGELPPAEICEYLADAFDAILQNQEPKKALLLSNPPHRKQANVRRDIAIATAVRELMNCGERRDQAIDIIAKRYHKSPSRIETIYKQHRSDALTVVGFRSMLERVSNNASILQRSFTAWQTRMSEEFAAWQTRSLTARTAGFSRGLTRAQRQVATFSGSVARSASTVKGYGRGLTGLVIGGGLSLMVKNSFSAIDATAKVSDKLGVASEKLAGLQYAARLSGNSVKAFNTGLQRMTRRVAQAAQGTGTARGSVAVYEPKRDVQSTSAQRAAGDWRGGKRHLNKGHEGDRRSKKFQVDNSPLEKGKKTREWVGK